MTPEQFVYWLKGFYELNEPKNITEKQTLIIKDHLNLVFGKITPDRNINNIPNSIEKGNTGVPINMTLPVNKRSKIRPGLIC